MDLKNSLGFLLGRSVIKISRAFNFGYGGTWPGEIALSIDGGFLKKASSGISDNVILIAGTNGKTTTSLLIKTILEKSGHKVIHNISGANLVNGIASAFIENADLLNTDSGKVFGVFEVDENSLPKVLDSIIPKAVVFLNLFRDQLDRYGEVDVIAEKWQKAISKLPTHTKIILNSDDPQIAFLGKSLKSNPIYFGLNKIKNFLKAPEHATDSIFCLNCSGRLTYNGFYYSHIGIWQCKQCGMQRPLPKYSNEIAVMPGFYNLYNTLAAYSTAKELGLSESLIIKAFKEFKPAFGRQEKLVFKGKKIAMFLSKNPAGFNQSIKTVIGLKAQNLLVLLNDRIPDGTDVSWIWDVDFEEIKDATNITVSGDRVYDLALRMKYAGATAVSEENLKKALGLALDKTAENEILYILPTYSAMLEVRKLLTGKKIL